MKKTEDMCIDCGQTPAHEECWSSCEDCWWRNYYEREALQDKEFEREAKKRGMTLNQYKLKYINHCTR